MTRSFADIEAEIGPSRVVDDVNEFLAGIDLSFRIAGHTIDPLGGATFNISDLGITIGAAMTFVESENKAAAWLGDGAHVVVNGNLLVSAYAESRPQASASSRAVSDDSGDAIVLGGSISVPKVANQATAFIGPSAIVDVDQVTRVEADARVLDPLPLFDPNPTIATGGNVFVDSNTTAGNVSDELTEARAHLAAALADPNLIGTSYVHAAEGASGTNAIGGGFNLLDVYNMAASAIASGVQLNQRTTTASVDQTVIVDASSLIEVTVIAGIESVLSFSEVPTSDVAAGGYFSAIFADNYARAYIDDLAHVHAAADLVLNAHVQSHIFNTAETGAEAGDVAVDGAFALVVLGHESLAFIEDRAVVTADRVILQASDGSIVTNIAGGTGTAPEVGVGVAAAFTLMVQPSTLEDRVPIELIKAGNDFENFGLDDLAGEIGGALDQPGGTTDEATEEALGFFSEVAEEAPGLLGGSAVRAFIGDAVHRMGPDGTGGEVGTVDAVSQIVIDADSVMEIWTAAVAGAESDAGFVADGGEEEVRGLGFGLGFSGDIAFNSVEHTVEVFLRDVSLVTAPVIREEARDTPQLTATAGGIVFGTNLGLGGSFARNGLFAQTRAYTQDVVIATDDLDLLALATPRTFAFADGVAGSKENLAVAGSVTKTDVINIAEAAVGGRTVATVGGDVRMLSRANLGGVASAGVAAFNVFGNALGSVGAALNLGQLVNEARAFAGPDAAIDAAGDVELDAGADETVHTLAAAFNVSAGDGQHNAAYINTGGADPFGGLNGESVSLDDLLTTSIALADVDADGDLDLITGSFAQSARRYLNDGNGAFDVGASLGDDWLEAANSYDTDRVLGAVLPPLTLGIAAADVDLDGDPDVITGNYGEPNRVYINDGNGNFGAGAGFPIGTGWLVGNWTPRTSRTTPRAEIYSTTCGARCGPCFSMQASIPRPSRLFLTMARLDLSPSGGPRLTPPLRRTSSTVFPSSGPDRNRSDPAKLPCG